MGYGPDGRGLIPDRGKKVVLFSIVQADLEEHLA
jgi:hypothetical protein